MAELESCQSLDVPAIKSGALDGGEKNTHDVSSLLANVGENCCSFSAQKTTKQVFFTIS